LRRMRPTPWRPNCSRRVWGRRRYLLRLVGQSMVGARIEDGNLLFVEEVEVPPDRAMVVAFLRGGEEVTMKRTYGEEKKVKLSPENGDHEELVLPAEDVRVRESGLYGRPSREQGRGRRDVKVRSC
jgi:repressor LexA